MLSEIREMGLYIDEHRDFNELMIADRIGRGKEPKPKTHSTKKWKYEDETWTKDV